MRICRVDVFPLDIPFVDEFAHTTKARRSSDAVLFRVTSETGFQGWGETLVRPYVTGETRADLDAGLRELASALGSVDWRLDPAAANPLAALSPLSETLDAVLAPLQAQRPERIIAWNGLRCGLETALLDALLRESDLPLAQLLPPLRKEVLYSAVISAGSAEKALKMTRHFKQLGLAHFKLKVTGNEDLELVREVRALLGPAASLRLDANTAFNDVTNASAFAHALEAHGIAAMEQPLPRGDVSAWAALQRMTSIPLMPDESLITATDAEELIAAKACGFFNLRIAKLGGLAPTLRIARMAEEAGIRLQLGCLVGETAILSAYGRALAAHLPHCEFVEGSYGNLLLKDDVARQSVRFGFGGKALLMRGFSNGIDVDELVVAKYATTDAWSLPCL